MNRRLLFESAGFSLLLVLPFIASLLVPGSTALFHHRFAFQKPLGGLLLAVAFIFLLGLATCLILRRVPKFPRSIAAGFLAGFVIWWTMFAMVSIVQSLPSFTGETNFDRFILALQPRLLVLNSLVPMIVAGMAVIKPKWTDGLVRSVRFGLAAFSFCGLWMLPQIAFTGFFLRPISEFDHSSDVSKASHDRRIIWVLFDELSYKLAIESTPKSVDLPNFHSLALQSSSFGNVQPPAYYTDRIVPAVLSGKDIWSIKSSSTGALLYRETRNGGWQRFDPNVTLFGKARDTGWAPAAAGWYNPYCRIFASVLTTCFWQPGFPSMIPFERIGASRRASLLENALIIPRFFLELFSGIGEIQPVGDQDRDIQDYQTLMKESQRLIENGKLQFVFLHLPVPHPPGFYDREKHALCRCGNYLDNLVLADDTLGVLRHEIEQSPWADQTTLIVSSDHSWRVHMWESRGSFTPEEAEISQGTYEPRPVFLVHFPGQATATQFTAPFAELNEYEVISSMLDGKVESPETLKSFVDRRAKNASRK